MSNDDDIARFFGGNAADTTTDSSDQPDFSLDTPAEDTTEPASEAVAARVEAEEAADGEIAVDVYQTDSNVVIVSPIAGVTAAELEFTDDAVTITGERAAEHLEQQENLLIQEIFWGSFARTVKLPVACDVESATHTFKDGVLTVTIPKAAKAKKRVVTVKDNK